MSVLFDQFTLRIWRSIFMVYLDNWSMLYLIQTNKLLNKHKKYVYMMIFQTITTLNCTHPNFHLTRKPSYKLLYDNTTTYKYLIYKDTSFGQINIVYNFDNLKLLVKNNSKLRFMLEKYIKGLNKQGLNLGTNNYTELKALMSIH
jgi:hypothetical protein